MKAVDLMSTPVTSATPETRLPDLARMMLEHRISALPVIDSNDHLVGIVSEADLMRRTELGTDRRRPWWLRGFIEPTLSAADFIKAHGRQAADVMSGNVVSVTEDTPVETIVDLFDRYRIKRVPVVRDGRVVGIVTRRDIVRALAPRSSPSAEVTAADDAIREGVVRQLQDHPWWRGTEADVIVTDGVVHVWGCVDTTEEADAVRVVSANVDGVKRVKSHLTVG